jgi:proprotein convertase subtilisin/kexin type 5
MCYQRDMLPNTHYVDPITGEIKPCEGECQFCDTSSGFCFMCNQNFYLDYFQGTCSETCPEGFYLDTEYDSCQNCNYPCATCLSENECLTCGYGLFFEETSQRCVDRCESGYFGVYMNADGTIQSN